MDMKEPPHALIYLNIYKSTSTYTNQHQNTLINIDIHK